jgi:hypothetical protein
MLEMPRNEQDGSERVAPSATIPMRPYCDAYTEDEVKIGELHRIENGAETWHYNFAPGVHSKHGKGR